MLEGDLKPACEAFEKRGVDDEGDYIDVDINLDEAPSLPEDNSLVPKGAPIDFSALTQKATQRQRQKETEATLSSMSRERSGLSALEAHRRKQDVLASQIFPAEQDLTRLRLKLDHSACPLWISPEDGHLGGFQSHCRAGAGFLGGD